MIQIRKSGDRGKADLGWLKSQHTFSFADYYDPEHMGYRSLRVINEDVVAPGTGFGKHPHREMEIITYVVSGAVQHQDSEGNEGVIHPGEIQVMSAGAGILHSEMNPSATEPLHLLQIWIEPNVSRGTPGYVDAKTHVRDHRGSFVVLASNDGRNGSLKIKQQAVLSAGIFPSDAHLEYKLPARHGAWVQVVHGTLSVNGAELAAGDGASAEEEETLSFTFKQDSEVLLFDLA